MNQSLENNKRMQFIQTNARNENKVLLQSKKSLYGVATYRQRHTVRENFE